MRGGGLIFDTELTIGKIVVKCNYQPVDSFPAARKTARPRVKGSLSRSVGLDASRQWRCRRLRAEARPASADNGRFGFERGALLGRMEYLGGASAV